MKNFKNGFIKENPVFCLYLGMCSTLALSTNLNNALGMGLCVTIVLIFSNLIISLIRNITPDEIRIPVYIVVIATLVSVVELLVHAYIPALFDALGAFLSLIVVNCIILGRAEAFAKKNPPLASIIDGLGMGLGYTFAIVILSVIREFLSTAWVSFYNPFDMSQLIIRIGMPQLENYTISLFSSSVGAFLTFAVVAALFALINQKAKEGKK
ncbi:MAG: electron transport complex subunit RsxE [Erysipelotrichaceae bacterium]|nr:electron transport complex subunit RsxE [Erysipelotrichaceae bacterium]